MPIGGYIDVLVAIDDNVDEDNFPDLLDTIEQEFTLASARPSHCNTVCIWLGVKM